MFEVFADAVLQGAMAAIPDLLRSGDTWVRVPTLAGTVLLFAAGPLLLFGVLYSSGICIFGAIACVLAFLCLIVAAALLRRIRSRDP